MTERVPDIISRQPGEPTSKPPLLFVPGLRYGARCWDEHWLPAAAAAGWPSYAVSLRERRGGARASARDVLRAAAELPERPALVGHSSGGLAVQHALSRSRARAVVLVASLPPEPDHRAGPPRVPVLVLASPDDPLVPAADHARTARRYRTQPHWFPGMGHDLMLEPGWEAPLAAMLDWLEENVVAATPV